jgi:hypothetical protein
MGLPINKFTISAEFERAAALADVDHDGVVTEEEVAELKRRTAAGELGSEAPSAETLDGVERLVRETAAAIPAAPSAPAATSVSAASVLCGCPLEVIDVAGDLRRLNDTQRTALANAGTRAADLSAKAHEQLLTKIKSLGYSEADLERCLTFMRDEVPATINISPDKQLTLQMFACSTTTMRAYAVPVDRTQTLIDAFLVDSTYRNQFETGVTSGSATAYPGGNRDDWEKTIFSGDYHQHDIVANERPKYGAINVGLRIGGGASCYGSCYMVLRPGARTRATITPTNSSGCNADQVGTLANCQHVLAGVDDGKLKATMEAALHGTRDTSSTWGYVEMQMHGPVEFDKDVAELVAAAQFRGTEYEDKLRRFCKRNSIKLSWQDGSNITADEG